MLRNKWFMVVVIALAVLVLAWQLIPSIMERASRDKGPSETEIAKTAVQTAPELDVEAPTRDVGSRMEAAPAVSAVARPGEPEAKWMKEFAAAGRDTSRSPFQRKHEGLGKIWITSRPSEARVYINGLRQSYVTDCLIPWSFPPGKYTLELKKEGYETYREELVIPEGLKDFEEITTINAALQKREINVQAARKGQMRVQYKPDVLVTVVVYGGRSPDAVIACRWYTGEAREVGGWIYTGAVIKYVVRVGDVLRIPTVRVRREKETVVETYLKNPWFVYDETLTSTPTSFTRYVMWGAGAEKAQRKVERIKKTLEFVWQEIEVLDIQPDYVTIRNRLDNLDYNFPVGQGDWSIHEALRPLEAPKKEGETKDKKVAQQTDQEATTSL